MTPDAPADSPGAPSEASGAGDTPHSEAAAPDGDAASPLGEAPPASEPSPAAEAAHATEPPPELRHYRLTFTGRASEYFRVWIVSLFLSLVTLGIYSAWGKVRKRRYIYSHTRLDGTGFEYRAAPLAILRGRIIALLLFGGLALAAHFVPIVQVAFIVLIVLLTPWIVVAAARFNARNSTWRNIPFAFDGRVGEAARIFLGGTLIAIVSFGLAYPWFRMRRARFIAGHHRFGGTPFAAHLSTGDFAVMYVLAMFAMGGAFVLLLFLTAGAVAVAGDPKGGEPPGFVGIMSVAFTYGLYLVIFAFVRARTINIILNGTTIGPLRLVGSLRGWMMTWLYLSNIVAIIATAGLATAWATIRMARYRAQTLDVYSYSSLESLPGGVAIVATATGSEVSDLFDVDVSL
ncbi:MAG TPA: DUF898 family protein [Gemmatimonadaceae bacterium]|nr:DUF898 family protein [Gemmatimonadaceae bacterium]